MKSKIPQSQRPSIRVHAPQNHYSTPDSPEEQVLSIPPKPRRLSAPSSSAPRVVDSSFEEQTDIDYPNSFGDSHRPYRAASHGRTNYLRPSVDTWQPANTFTNARRDMYPTGGISQDKYAPTSAQPREYDVEQPESPESSSDEYSEYSISIAHPSPPPSPVRARSVDERSLPVNRRTEHRSHHSSPVNIAPKSAHEIWRPSITPEEDKIMSTPYAIARSGSTRSLGSTSSVSPGPRTTERPSRLQAPAANRDTFTTEFSQSSPVEFRGREAERKYQQEHISYESGQRPRGDKSNKKKSNLDRGIEPIALVDGDGHRVQQERKRPQRTNSRPLIERDKYMAPKAKSSSGTITDFDRTENFTFPPPHSHLFPQTPISNQRVGTSSSRSPSSRPPLTPPTGKWGSEEYQSPEPDHSWSTPIIAELDRIFHDKTRYKHLLNRSRVHAQRLLDLFQMLMDIPDLEEEFRSDLITATQRLSKNSKLYPTCFDLKDAVQLEGDGPVTAGSFADIHKGRFQNQLVCVKSIRVYQKFHVNYIMKNACREAILWGQLSHRNLLPFYGIYQHNSRLICLISPWMENGHIKEFLQHNTNADRVHLALDVAMGVSYLHGRGIIHGDLKGPNILVDPSGIACLADFGLSGVIDSQILNWTSQSSPASSGGSVRWQAPELLTPEISVKDGKVSNTKATDVYAWSCVCYEIFTGRDPFFEDSRGPTVTLKIMRGDKPSRPPPSSSPRIRWGLTKPIWDLMNDCWEYDPTNRPVIDDVVALLKREAGEDLRPAQRRAYIPASRFRNAVNKPHRYPSIEDLEAMLLSR